jgi:hypothetical protein
MPHRTTTRALTIVGALTALAGTAVLGASPARADTDVVPFAHALVKDRGISNPTWVRLKLPSGVTGYVPALYLKGNDKGNVANHC